jgi:imidazolonepropionase-like amidohydrolase
MIDVLNARAVSEPQIVITDGRIVSVGRRGDPAPVDAKRLDLGTRTLLPG